MFKYLIAGAASALALTLAVPGYAIAPQQDSATVILTNGTAMNVDIEGVYDTNGDVVSSTEFMPEDRENSSDQLADRSRAYQDLAMIEQLEREGKANDKPVELAKNVQLTSLAGEL